MSGVDPVKFLRAAPTGMRVVIRYRLPDGMATDVLGFISASDDTHVVVASVRGLETIAYNTVIAAKEVPPAPAKRERSAEGHPLAPDGIHSVIAEGP